MVLLNADALKVISSPLWLEITNPFTWTWEVHRLLIICSIITFSTFFYPFGWRKKGNSRGHHNLPREMRELINS